MGTFFFQLPLWVIWRNICRSGGGGWSWGSNLSAGTNNHINHVLMMPEENTKAEPKAKVFLLTIHSEKLFFEKKKATERFN